MDQVEYTALDVGVAITLRVRVSAEIQKKGDWKRNFYKILREAFRVIGRG